MSSRASAWARTIHKVQCRIVCKDGKTVCKSIAFDGQDKADSEFLELCKATMADGVDWAINKAAELQEQELL